MKKNNFSKPAFIFVALLCLIYKYEAQSSVNDDDNKLIVYQSPQAFLALFSPKKNAVLAHEDIHAEAKHSPCFIERLFPFPFPDKVAATPPIEHFYQHAYLVHTGELPFQETLDSGGKYSQEMIIKPGGMQENQFFSYWTFGGVVPVDNFQRFNFSSCAIIVPFAKVAQQIVNISAQEVMIAGPVKLGAGDIVVVNEDKTYLQQDARLKNCMDNSGIKWTVYKGGGYNIENSLGEKRRIVKKIIEEKGGWALETGLGFWTPVSPAWINNKQISNHLFFNQLREREPALSIGTQYYSVYNKACLFSKFLEIQNELINKNCIFPSLARSLQRFLKRELEDYINSFSFLNANAGNYILNLLANYKGIRSGESLITLSPVKASTENFLYKQDGFLFFILDTFKSFKRDDLMKLMQDPHIIKEVTPYARNRIIEVFNTIKLIEGYSPLFRRIADTRKSRSFPLFPLSLLPFTWKMQAYQWAFQLYIDSEMDLQAVIDFYEEIENDRHLQTSNS